MKAIILAAGEGKRLRPLTEDIPKCLLPIHHKPLLEYWLDTCEKHKISEVLINGHYLADMLEEFLERVKGRYSFTMNYVYEEELLGTGGTVKQNYGFIKDEAFFLLCHGDNFTSLNITDFIDFHVQKKSRLSIALYKTNMPKQCGIIEEMDEDCKILRFVEKPQYPKSDLASSAIFLMSPEVIERFPDERIIDFSKEILPLYQGEMYGYCFQGFNIDIGTEENYTLAKRIASDLDHGNLEK